MQRVQKTAREAALVVHSRTVDSQKDALYSWENDWEDWNRYTCPLKRVRQYVRTACAKYNLPPPSVVSHRSKMWPTYFPDRARISFSRAYQNPPIALHEAAHYIIFCLYGETVEDHGREFLGVYLWLMEAAKIAPAVALHASARAAGLRWRDMSPLRCRKN